MRYTPRDLRSADLFAMILIGFGLLMLVVGIVVFSNRADATSSTVITKSPEGKIDPKSKSSLPPGVGVAVCGFTLGCLGAALSFKVRQLIRTGGIEPSEYGERATP